MRTRTFVVLLLVLVAGGFAGGMLSRRGAVSRTAVVARPAAPEALPSSAAPGLAATRTVASTQPHRRQRFPRPPLPDNDPGLAEWIRNGPEEPPRAAIDARLQDVDRRLEELFGKDFPVDKRKQVMAAQEQWIRAHSQAVFAYYNGEISQGELTTQIHQNMITMARETGSALSADQYRAYFGLEPGVDPFLVIASPGLQAGEPLPAVPSPQPSSPAPAAQPGHDAGSQP